MFNFAKNIITCFEQPYHSDIKIVDVPREIIMLIVEYLDEDSFFNFKWSSSYVNSSIMHKNTGLLYSQIFNLDKVPLSIAHKITKCHIGGRVRGMYLIQNEQMNARELFRRICNGEDGSMLRKYYSGREWAKLTYPACCEVHRFGYGNVDKMSEILPKINGNIFIHKVITKSQYRGFYVEELNDKNFEAFIAECSYIQCAITINDYRVYKLHTIGKTKILNTIKKITCRVRGDKIPNFDPLMAFPNIEVLKLDISDKNKNRYINTNQFKNVIVNRKDANLSKSYEVE